MQNSTSPSALRLFAAINRAHFLQCLQGGGEPERIRKPITGLGFRVSRRVNERYSSTPRTERTELSAITGDGALSGVTTPNVKNRTLNDFPSLQLTGTGTGSRAKDGRAKPTKMLLNLS
jgi:hypothetical protein